MEPFSILIPAYNEETGVESAVEKIKTFLQKKYSSQEYEIIAINDGSKDKTRDILSSISGIKLINHDINKGYGAAIKSGARAAKYNWIMLYDSDGQHSPEYIPALLEKRKEADMVIGKRTGNNGPLLRRPGKKVLKWIAQYLTGQKIPDINSGLRVINKKYFDQFSHLYPNGFSISTTSTMAFLTAGLNIAYTPIKVDKREGKSMVRPRHAIQMFLLISRIVMLFNPLRIFFPASVFTGLLMTMFLAYDVVHLNISSTTTILFLATVIIFCFGLLADQISAIRRDKHNF
jgi:glycosyltransferase involved in cell wall biosynthesis